MKINLRNKTNINNGKKKTTNKTKTTQYIPDTGQLISVNKRDLCVQGACSSKLQHSGKLDKSTYMCRLDLEGRENKV